MTAVNLNTVVGMFQRLEQRLDGLEANKCSQQHNGACEQHLMEVSDVKKSVEQCEQEIRELRRENFILDRAAKNTACLMSEITDRLEKLEIQNHKKMIAISGLHVYGERKLDMMEEVQYFLESEILVQVSIDDVYLIGAGTPPICVVTFSSLQDKTRVMINKSLLKGIVNREEKPIFINDYYASQHNEKRRYEREMMYQNEIKRADLQHDMKFVKGKLTLNDEQITSAKKVTTPQPLDILDMHQEELSYTLKLPMDKSQEIIEKGSRFICYTMPVQSCEQVQSAYMKVKLLHPAAQHVICSYKLLPESNDVFNTDYCDDGEHGAGRFLKSMIDDSGVSHRVFLIVRYYGGIKLQGARFECFQKVFEDVLSRASDLSVSTQRHPNPSQHDTDLKQRLDNQETPPTHAHPPMFPQANSRDKQSSAEPNIPEYAHIAAANKYIPRQNPAIRGARPGYTQSRSARRGPNAYRGRRASSYRGASRGRVRGQGQSQSAMKSYRGKPYYRKDDVQTRKRDSPTPPPPKHYNQRRRNQEIKPDESFDNMETDNLSVESQSLMEDWSQDRQGAFENESID